MKKEEKYYNSTNFFSIFLKVIFKNNFSIINISFKIHRCTTVLLKQKIDF